ncbi:hypothetical protein E2C01_014887 [Portunus trituberculatus]|uniref:Uncharacterized protein n=1 Tax=Portunus trituberculatus TaxID=210409 RepID=A0A5B7DL49_PORTR|nr:hypothetical protein [Portunus trituberculatus]
MSMATTALSVWMSHSTSPGWMGSPSFFAHWTMVPSSMVGDRTHLLKATLAANLNNDTLCLDGGDIVVDGALPTTHPLTLPLLGDGLPGGINPPYGKHLTHVNLSGNGHSDHLYVAVAKHSSSSGLSVEETLPTTTTTTTTTTTHNDAILFEQQVAVDFLLASDKIKPLGHLGRSYVARVLWYFLVELQSLLLSGHLDVVIVWRHWEVLVACLLSPYCS